jgi:small subunit ribosomal protein S16
MLLTPPERAGSPSKTRGDTTPVAVKIRLRRVGKVHAPYYRIVVTDSRTKRDGRFIEQIGKYHPKDDPSYIEVDSERAQYWLGVGAQPSDPVRAILSKTGDWQKFKGEPAPEPLLQPKSRRNRDDAFNEALKDAGSQPKDDATTPKKKSAKKSAAAKDEAKDDAKPKTEAKADKKADKKADAKDTKAKADAKDAEPKAEAESPSEEKPADEAPAAEAAAETDAPAESESGDAASKS